MKYEIKIPGRTQAEIRDKWLASENAKKLLAGTASGIYLENRLARAFIAGVDAALDISNGREGSK